MYTPLDVLNWNNTANASAFTIFERRYFVEKVIWIGVL
jgi:hypothetical protein